MLTQKEMENQRQAVHEGVSITAQKKRGKQWQTYTYITYKYIKVEGGGYMLHNVKKGKATVKQKGGGSIVETIIIQNH